MFAGVLNTTVHWCVKHMSKYYKFLPIVLKVCILFSYKLFFKNIVLDSRKTVLEEFAKHMSAK